MVGNYYLHYQCLINVQILGVISHTNSLVTNQYSHQVFLCTNSSLPREAIESLSKEAALHQPLPQHLHLHSHKFFHPAFNMLTTVNTIFGQILISL